MTLSNPIVFAALAAAFPVVLGMQECDETGPLLAGVVNAHHDHVGSVSLVTPAPTGAGVASRAGYTPFGEPSHQAGPSVFAGHDYDTESELYYMRARYYDPQIARFLSPDPALNGGGETFGQLTRGGLALNAYTYADNRPTVATDPTGRSSIFLAEVSENGTDKEVYHGLVRTSTEVRVALGIALGAEAGAMAAMPAPASHPLVHAWAKASAVRAVILEEAELDTVHPRSARRLKGHAKNHLRGALPEIDDLLAEINEADQFFRIWAKHYDEAWTLLRRQLAVGRLMGAVKGGGIGFGVDLYLQAPADRFEQEVVIDGGSAVDFVMRPLGDGLAGPLGYYFGYFVDQGVHGAAVGIGWYLDNIGPPERSPFGGIDP